MLRKLKGNEIETAANLAYVLSKSPLTNSYPLLYSQKEFFEEYERSLNYPENELLGYFMEDELIGVTYLRVLKKDLYLQTVGLFIKKDYELVMSTFIDYLHINYNGYKIYIGYPMENEIAASSLLSHGFRIVDSSINQRLEKGEFIPSVLQHFITKVDHTNYAAFANYHDSKANDMYWNSTRIKEDFDHWIIYSFYSDSQVRGSIAAKKGKMDPSELEIFAVFIDKEIANQGIEEDLISAALIDGFENHAIKDVTYFIDSVDEKAVVYSKKLGFKVRNNYRCFSMKL